MAKKQNKAVPVKFGVDTNMLVSTHREDKPDWRVIAKSFVERKPVISSQVMSEYLNTMERKYKESRPQLPHLEIDKLQVLRKCMTRMEGCPIQLVTMETLVLAEAIVLKYKYQMFDAIIVASNLEAGCTTLYTEDMNHKQIIYKQLQIINPFLDD